MAKRFTDLNELTVAATDDVIAIVDTSANETKRITLTNLLNNFVDAVHLKSNSVITTKILDGAVTAAKIETQQTWQAPTLLNSWANYGSGYNDVGYYKDSLGRVHFKGLIKNGTTAAGTVLFNLPVGYRPAQNYILNGRKTGGADCEIRANSDGTVTIGDGGAAAGWTCLDGLNFRAS